MVMVLLLVLLLPWVLVMVSWRRTPHRCWGQRHALAALVAVALVRAALGWVAAVLAGGCSR